MQQRTRIKICGITRAQDLDAAVQAGADAVGFVFYSASARCVTIELAAELASRLPPFVTPVALFVNAHADLVQGVVQAIPQVVLQFHGDETADQCQAAKRPYVRAARMAPGFDLLNFAAQFRDAQALLLDAHVEGYGGGGKVFDWSVIPRNVPRPVVLSGGLHAANVADGILQVRPSAVDVSSGVEVSKGIKDPIAIRRFCEAVRLADEQLAQAAASNPL
ncbi:MAG: phosphoribosylanthranilate isomerase [Burkholderiales bacterium]